MRCQKASELMSLRLDLALLPQDEQALEQHLLTCNSCRAEWQAVQRACELFSDVPLATPATDLSSRVMTSIRRRESRLAMLRNSLVLFLGAVILTALCLSLWMTASSPVEAIVSNPPLVSAIASVLVGLLDVLGTLLRAVALVVQTVLACPSSVALAGYVALAGALTLWWMRLASGRTRLAPRRKMH